MLDTKFVVENVDAVRRNCANRGVQADVERVLALDCQRRAMQKQLEELNRRANEVSKSIGKTKDPLERDARKEEGRRLRAQTSEIQPQFDRLVAEQLEILKLIPNMTHPDAPVGADESANRESRLGKAPRREFDFEPADHVEIGERLGILDLDGGARVAGHGFYFLKNDGVLLELALQRFALDVLAAKGFELTTTPDLARTDIVEGIGFVPRGPERQIYNVADTDLSLIATAEITLGGLYAGEVLEAESLPLRICGLSHCFRTEAGAHGRATRGLYRVHQFTKVEMFVFATPAESDALLEELCEIECEIFDALGLPYRVIDTATGDLGGPAYRKFDLEVWMPGRGGYGEVTSTSNCTDYQARRLDIRFRTKGEKGTRLVHTLNGTAIACSRAIVAILEHYQQRDGSVLVPEVLQKWVGRERIEVPQ